MLVRGIIALTMPALVLLSASVSDGDVMYVNSVKYVQGFRLQTGVFRVLANSSYIGCVRECLLRQHCRAITYYRTYYICHLGSQSGVLERVDDNKTLSSHPTDWNPPKSIVGNCSEKPCAVGQRCTELSSGSIVCINTECSDPPEITSSTTSGLRPIGITISYESVANSSYSPIISGNPNITCKADTTWTSLDFTVTLCPSNFQIVGGAYCIMLVTSQTMTPADGDQYCQTEGARLVWMTSVEKYDAIIAIIQTGRYFLAGTDVDVEGTWKLPNGELMTWLHSRAEVIDTDNDDCLTYDHSLGKLRDLPCSYTEFIICEIV
ncbi:hypothetical protein KP79_PYT15465 [Mizuhopecten yessoensis]|uniref:C-type lectin domain-containing protein n=2 Tax=Mizuhopecten yessoensis TaxID=6573 RepID=A0A210QBY6_MIZYE|nr:hypothetical protein KP79_PYT15465 [Mizuhopecten yessoensis]